MKNLFCINIVYTRKNVQNLLSVRYELQHPFLKQAVQVLGIVLIFSSMFFPSWKWKGLLLLFLGCILVTNANNSARREAVRMEKLLLPVSVEYHFQENSFTTISKGTAMQVLYPEIKFFLRDRQFIYLFTKQKTGYLIDASGGEGDGLYSFLREKIPVRCWPAGWAAVLAFMERMRLRRHK